MKQQSKSRDKEGRYRFFLSGDLLNQIISSSFAARTLAIPYLGLFGACSSSMEGLSIAAQLVDSKAADYVLAATSSHNASAEKQFRYPTEYGRKPPTAQWTVTESRRCPGGQGRRGPRITCATIGRVVDMGISDPSTWARPWHPQRWIPYRPTSGTWKGTPPITM